MLTIRLQRVGRTNEPTFRVVVTDSKTAAKKNRRFHEIVGSYDARDKNVTKLDGERIKHFIAHGAQPTGTVHNLLISNKIIEGKKRNVLPQKTVVKKEAATA
jgi:small subunit ribosomal protein S16